jgi:hypothetical protein
MNINITPLSSSIGINSDEDFSSSYLESQYKETESCYETSRKCLQLADTLVLNNKRLVDENQRLQRMVHLMSQKMNQMNDDIKDLLYEKEMNKLFLVSYIKTFMKLTEKEKNDKCPICLELLMELPNEDIVKTSCSHMFHGSCYYRNRSTSDDSCGICRQRHVPFDIGFIDSQKDFHPYTENQIKNNLIRVLNLVPETIIQPIEEIMTQIYQKSKIAVKYF